MTCGHANTTPKPKQVWVNKEDHLCLIVHTTLRVLDTCMWYLNNGCSKHMPRNKSLFQDLEQCKGDNVTFGDGSKPHVMKKKKGTVNITGL